MFLDSGWMDEIVKECLSDELDEKEYKKKKLPKELLTDDKFLLPILKKSNFILYYKPN